MMKIINYILSKIKSFDYNQAFKQFIEDFIKFPIYLLAHPFKGFEDFKLDKKGKMHVAIIYLLLLVISTAFNETSGGFLILSPQNNEHSIVKIFLLITVPVVLIAIGNWSITSLFDGKGKVTEIFKVICYAIIPLVWVGFPMTIISNFLIMEELAIHQAMLTIATVLVGYLGFFGLLVVHEFGMAKTIITIIASIVAIAVIIFIGILILTLFQQLYGFIISVYEEFIMRIS